MLIVRMATGENPARMSYRRFMHALGHAQAVKRYLAGGEYPGGEVKAPEPDLAALGLG